MSKPHLGALLAAFALAASVACQQTGNPKYPLRLHVLVIDDTHRTERFQPNWCSASIPNFGGDAGTAGGTADSCGSGSPSFGGDDDFSGAGQADLVTLPGGAAQALSFSYEGCSRVRVPPGFQGLPARWKKPAKLEVLIPSDRIVADSHSAPAQRCTLSATVHEFVYLRLRNGSLLKVSQEAYSRKPGLRVFLSGGAELLQPRLTPTVSVGQLLKKP